MRCYLQFNRRVNLSNVGQYIYIFRNAYGVLLALINGSLDKDVEVDAAALQLIREAYEELMTEMASVQIDEASIKAMLKPESFE